MVIVSTAIVTLLLASFLVPAAPRIASLILRRPRRTSETTGTGEPPPELVIIGFGPAGHAIGERVRELGRRVLVLDLNPAAKRKAETMGLRSEIGDAQQEEVLEHAGVRGARLVAITLPARSAALTVLAQVKRCAPNAHIVVRSRYRRHEPEFAQGGAHAVIGDEDEVGSRLADHVGEKLRDRPSGS